MLVDLMGRMDDTLTLAIQGYGWLPNRLRHSPEDVVRTRLLGQRTVALRGPDAARFFYDEQHIRRHGAIPEPLRTGSSVGRSVPSTWCRRVAAIRVPAIVAPGSRSPSRC
ncbi:hypothetical protein JMF97_10190 [Micromonospora fiedleri]|uniref:Uncharacterized protein n=1 Tax=Micromonospora fiedleri TaxID=1157498 RepID=A0ABS1UJK2_9ACTN|nr:hypothetical protein [Micromonospora fiedleri]MBL6276532.1 hypothetical protein [Micromonospora fiedleri]